MGEPKLDLEEIIREIPGLPKYFASNMGRIWSDKSKKWMAMQTCQKGYRHVMISVNGKYGQRPVHRLVLLAFAGTPELGQQCRHLNGNPGDNRLENLKWGTQSENMQDKFRHGTAADGPNNCRTKLNAAQVEEIRRLYSEGHKQVHLAKQYGVTQANISFIVLRKGWKRYA